MRKITGFIITAGHLDIEWYQPLRSYRFWTAEALEDLKVAARRADFGTYVLDGQVFPLEEYLEVVPEDEPEMRRLIKDGKLSIGPFYTQFDEWLPSAESMMRNCLYGNRKSRAFGGTMRAGYLPDNFGHPRQIPQILTNFGIDSLMFMRGMPEVAGGHPDEFLYEGLDGSRVLTCHFREGYAGAFDIFHKKIDPKQPREVPYYGEYISFEYHRSLAVHDDPQRIARNMIDNVRRIESRFPSGIIPLIAGADHLPPQINVGDSVKAANELQDDIHFVMGSVEDYVRAVYEHIQDPAVYSMELVGSRYHYILLGALSTRTYLKRQNFACEALLERYTEPLDALASLMGCAYPDKPRLLDEAWRAMMINSAHDSIHGSSTDEVHVEMEARFASVRQIAAGVIHDALAHLGRKTLHWWASLPQPGKGVLVYAPVSAPFAQPAELWLAVGDQPVTVVDHEGRELPTQVLDRQPIARNGVGLPRNDAFPAPVFRKVLFLGQFEAGSVETRAAVGCCGIPSNSLAAGPAFLENEFIRVEADGSLIHLRDKETGRFYHHMNLLEEEADAGDAWDYPPPWVSGESVRSTAFAFTSRLIENGPVRATLEMQGKMNVPACLRGDLRAEERAEIPITFQISLYRGIRRVDVKLRLDNTARDHRIRLHIPMGQKTMTILSQGHLAILERPVNHPQETEIWSQPPTQLYPCREWIAAADHQTGLAVALKGLYDYEPALNPLTREPDIRVTLLRGFALMGRLNTIQRSGPASDAYETPGAQCLGIQEIEWAYLPYRVAPDDKAPFLPAAQSFLYPPVAHAVRGPADGDAEPAVQSVFGWHETNLQFSAFKKCQDRDGYILRFYENQGKPVQAKIRISTFRKAWLSNMNEDTLAELPIQAESVTVAVGAWQAMTIKLS